MGDSGVAVFHKIGTNVQLIAVNTEFFAKEGTPQAHFVRESFSDSLVASALVVSQPATDDKAVLIEAGALLFGDIPGYLTRLETAFRIPYALDPKNTNIESVSNTEHLTGIEVQAHFAVPKLSPPPLTPPPVPLPPPPKATPDPRSFFVSFYYNFSPLPEHPMHPRVADERVGFFTTARVDYTDDVQREAARELRESLAPREEGSVGRDLGAQGADRLLARQEYPREVPPVGRRRHPRVEQGLREGRDSRTPSS